jgi:hypothetical protein
MPHDHSARPGYGPRTEPRSNWSSRGRARRTNLRWVLEAPECTTLDLSEWYWGSDLGPLAQLTQLTTLEPPRLLEGVGSEPPGRINSAHLAQPERVFPGE